MKLFKIPTINIGITSKDYDINDMFLSDIQTKETYKFMCKAYINKLKMGNFEGASEIALLIKDYKIMAYEKLKIDLSEIEKI